MAVLDGRRHDPALELGAYEDEGAGRKVLLPFPRRDERAIDVADVQLDKLGVDVTEVVGVVPRHEGRFVQVANHGYPYFCMSTWNRQRKQHVLLAWDADNPADPEAAALALRLRGELSTSSSITPDVDF